MEISHTRPTWPGREPAPVVIAHVLERAAAAAPDIEAVVCGSDRVTFSALEQRVGVARRALVKLGVEAGDHVAVCLGNGTKWVELFYAITSLGAVVVPLNTRYRADELAHGLRDSRSRFLLTAPRVLSADLVDLLSEVASSWESSALSSAGLPDLDCIVLVADHHDARADISQTTHAAQLPDAETRKQLQAPDGAVAWSDLVDPVDPDHLDRPDNSYLTRARPDDPALIQYTSGTTARPKGVVLTHRNMCLDAWASGMRMGLRAGDRFHSVRPFFHVAGSTLSVLASAQHMTTLVTMRRFEAGPALEVLEAERCTHFSGNDTIALMLLNHPDRPSRNLVLRGAWVAASGPVVRRVVEELGAHEAVLGYGLSEASPNVAQSAWWEALELRLAGGMPPEPGVRVEIRDHDTLAPLATGGSGEIWVRGWNVMLGYYGCPEETAATLVDGWLRTGDLGSLDEHGRLHFEGRAKEIIRVGGENVAPAEVEQLLVQHPAIQHAAVVGVPDPRLVEVPFAFVQLIDGATCEPDELIAWSKERISGFKAPRYVHLVPDFSTLGMTASSKIQKGRLVDSATKLASEFAIQAATECALGVPTVADREHS